MFNFKKKNRNADSDSVNVTQKASSAANQSDPPRKKRYIAKFFKYLSLLLLVAIFAATGGLIWTFQTTSGQQWLMRTANKLLAPPAGSNGPGYRITALNGSLPFNFEFGVEAFDMHGLWLAAPRNHFSLEWRELPANVHISSLSLENADILRLPEFPPDPAPAPPSPPVTLADVQHMLADAADFIDKKPWWLPAVKIEGVKIDNLLLPAELIAQTDADARLSASASLAANFVNNALNATLGTSLQNSGAQPISLQGFKFQAANASIVLEAGKGKTATSLGTKATLEAALQNPVLEMEDIPADLLGDKASFSLRLEAQAVTGKDNPGVSISLSGPDLDAGHAQLKSAIGWQSGSAWKEGELDGPANCNIDFVFSPPKDVELDSPLALLKAPAKLLIRAAGDFPRLDLNLDLDCADMEKAGHTVENLRLALAAKDIAVPFNDAAMAILEKEHHLDVNLSAAVDKENVLLATGLFFQALKDGNADTSWKAALRNLHLDALGVKGSGDVEALLPHAASPQLNGDIDLAISQWQSISRFLPDQKLSGNAKIDLKLATADINGATRQNAMLEMDIPQFGMHSVADGQGVSIHGVSGRVGLEDIFKGQEINGEIKAAQIEVAGMKIGADLKAAGPLAGPLAVELSSTGSATSKIAARWQPGKIQLNTLDLRMEMPRSDKSATKKGSQALGVRSTTASEIDYGDNGIGVRNLDLTITPSGRLRANGSLATDKLNFDLNLENMQFKPWQALVPQIPSGSANIHASLKGSPQRPAGVFRIGVNELAVPQVPIAPVTLALTGSVENSGSASALTARLEVDPKTLKALGASKAEVNARVPLLFGADGIPKPDMNGKLAAHVRWDGALGPVWNLLPMADMRLNGRIGINVNAEGSLSRPRIRGGVKMDKARFEDLLLGILLTDINLDLNLSEHGAPAKADGAGMMAALPGGMTLALNASDGRGGTIKIDGKGGLDGQNLDIKGKIDRLRPLRRRDIHIELSGNAKVTGSATAPVVDGEIIVNQGEVLLNNISIGGSVTTLPISSAKSVATDQKAAPVKKPAAAKKVKASGKAAPQKPAAGSGKGSLNVRINMLPRFTVEGRGLTSIWKANLLVTGTPEQPQITGNISVVKGNFDFLGKNFALSRGVVFFGGGSFSNPLLDIEMTNETPDLVAHILVTGPVDKMKLTLTSDPSLPRDDILSRVLFGRSINDLSRLEALQLAAAVAQLAGFGSGGGVLDFAKKTLGVDVLRLGTSSTDAAGEPGDQTAGGTTIEMGKYINDMIYMGVQQGLKPDSTAFIIQLELTPRTSLEVRTEQNNTWGGLRWKYNY